MARVDYEKQAADYDAARALPDEALAVWIVAVRRHVPAARTILDLGAGTGRFTKALAAAHDEATVVALEPSDGMRRQAKAKGIDVIAGRAEALPLLDATIDLAWLSNCIHHFDDLSRAAEELRRTATTVLIRSGFADSAEPSLFRFFPESRAVLESFPTTTETFATFEAAGFTHFYRETITELLANDLADMIPRVKRRADTALELISDEAFHRGVALLEEIAQRERGPVTNPVDLLVIR